MSDLRAQIIEALESRLATITIANGYQTNIGINVFPWRTAPASANDMPCILVYDRTLDRRYDGAGIGRVENTLNMAIVVCQASSDGLAQTRKAEGDVVKCLGGWDISGTTLDWLYIPKTELLNEQHNLDYWAVLLTVIGEYDSDHDQI